MISFKHVLLVALLGGATVGCIGYATTNTGREKYEHRPYLFAFTFNYVMGNAVQQRYRALHRGLESFLKNVNISGNRCFYVVDAQHC